MRLIRDFSVRHIDGNLARIVAEPPDKRGD